MEISRNATLPLHFLDLVARQALGAATCGASVGPGVSRIHLLDGSAANQRRASDLLSSFGSLQLRANKQDMTEGDADPIIHCRDSAIRADSELAYLILLDNEVYGQGSDRVTSGELSLTLREPVAGVYSIFIYRVRGNYASASLQIVVNEE